MSLSEATNENNKTNKVLNLIGKIGAPTGIITSFCYLILKELSNYEIAFISLMTMFLTLIVLFYHPIKEKISSPILIIIMLILLTLFYFGYEDIITKDTGLVKYFKTTNESKSEISLNIKNAKNEIIFFGTNFNVTAGNEKGSILNKLKEGVDIKYLIFNPYSKIISSVASDFDQSEEELRDVECLPALKKLLDIEKKWEVEKKSVKNPGSLEIKLYNQLPRFRAYVFDPDNEKGNSFITPYLYLNDSPEVPCFHFKNKSKGVFKDYYDNIMKLWSVSFKFDELNDLKNVEKNN